MADDAAIRQGDQACGLFKAQRTAHVEEVPNAHFNVARGSQERTPVTLHIQSAGDACCCGHQHRFGLEVDHLGGFVHAVGYVEHLVGHHFQATDLQVQLGHAHKLDHAGTGFNAQPAHAAVAQRLSSCRAQHGHGKLATCHGKTHGRGVDLVVGINDTIEVAVNPIRTAHTRKNIQVLATQQQLVHHHQTLVGQLNRGGRFFQAHRAAGVNKTGRADFEVTGGPDQLTPRAVHLQFNLCRIPRGHFERLRCPIQHLVALQGAGQRVVDQVELNLEVLRGGGHALHTHQGHLAGRGLHGHPAALACGGFVPGQRHAKLGVAHRHADGRRVGVVTQVDHAIAIGVAAVRSIDAHKGVQPGATNGQDAGVNAWTRCNAIACQFEGHV